MHMQLAPAVQLAQELVPGAIPKTVATIISLELLSRVRKVAVFARELFNWVSFNGWKLEINTGHAQRKIGGYIGAQFAQNITVMRWAAKALVVSSVIINHREMAKAQSLAFARWVQAIKGDYVSHVKTIPLTEQSGIMGKLFLASTVSWAKTNLQEAMIRVQKIALQTWRLIAASALYAMAIGDIYDVCSFTVRDEDVQDLAVNYHRVLEKVNSSKTAFLTFMQTNEATINQVCTALHMPFSANHLCAGSVAVISGASALHSGVAKVTAFAGEGVTNFVKEGISTFLLSINAPVPSMLLPTRNAFVDLKGQYAQQQYTQQGYV